MQDEVTTIKRGRGRPPRDPNAPKAPKPSRNPEGRPLDTPKPDEYEEALVIKMRDRILGVPGALVEEYQNAIIETMAGLLFEQMMLAQNEKTRPGAAKLLRERFGIRAEKLIIPTAPVKRKAKLRDEQGVLTELKVVAMSPALVVYSK